MDYNRRTGNIITDEDSEGGYIDPDKLRQTNKGADIYQDLHRLRRKKENDVFEGNSFDEDKVNRDRRGRFTSFTELNKALNPNKKDKELPSYPDTVEKETNAKGKKTVAKKFRPHYINAVKDKKLHDVVAKSYSEHAYDQAAERDVTPKRLGDLYDEKASSFAYPEKTDKKTGKITKKIIGNNDSGVVIDVNSGKIITVLDNQDVEEEVTRMNIVFTSEQVALINEGLNMTFAINESVQLSKPLAREIREYAEDIEVEEALDMDENGNDEISERGRLACDLVDLINSEWKKQYS